MTGPGRIHLAAGLLALSAGFIANYFTWLCGTKRLIRAVWDED